MINLPTNTIDHQVKINKNFLARIPRDKDQKRKNVEKKDETLEY
jgi:hypothetical protein